MSVEANSGCIKLAMSGAMSGVKPDNPTCPDAPEPSKRGRNRPVGGVVFCLLISGFRVFQAPPLIHLCVDPWFEHSGAESINLLDGASVLILGPYRNYPTPTWSCRSQCSLAWDEAELLRTSESERLPQEPLAHALSSSVI